VPLPERKFQVWHVDLSGTLREGKDGYTHFVLFTCVLTGWSVTVPLRDTTARSIAIAFSDHILKVYSTPEFITSDAGSNITAECIQQLYNALSIKFHINAAYIKNGTAFVERRFRMIWDRLSKMMPPGSNHNTWAQYLAAATHAINCSFSQTRYASPFELVFGILPRHPIDNLLKPSANTSSEVSDLILEQQRITTAMAEKAKENLLEARKRNASRINSKHRKDEKLKVGDRVLIDVREKVKKEYRDSNGQLSKSPKIARELYIGPFTITRQHTNTRFYLADATGRELKYSTHINRLHPWYEALLIPSTVKEIMGNKEEDKEIEELITNIYSPLGYTFVPQHDSEKTRDSAVSGNGNLNPGDGRVTDPTTTNSTTTTLDNNNRNLNDSNRNISFVSGNGVLNSGDKEIEFNGRHQVEATDERLDPSIIYREDLRRLTSNSQRVTRSGNRYPYAEASRI
jgi:hypothetical protein